MKLTLPMPPSANKLWRQWQGRTLLSREGRAYKAQVAALALREGYRPLPGTVAVWLDVYRAQRRGDLDNRVKATLDALRGVAFNDDAQVVELHARRFEDKAHPRVEVRVVEVQLAHLQLRFGEEVAKPRKGLAALARPASYPARRKT